MADLQIAPFFLIDKSFIQTNFKSVDQIYFRIAAASTLSSVLNHGTDRNGQSILWHDFNESVFSDFRFEEMAMRENGITDTGRTTYIHDGSFFETSQIQLHLSQIMIIYSKSPFLKPADLRQYAERFTHAVSSNGFAFFRDEPKKALLGVIDGFKKIYHPWNPADNKSFCFEL